MKTFGLVVNLFILYYLIERRVNINKRRYEILCILLNENDFVPLEHLKKTFKVSLRTINDDVKIINNYLLKYSGISIDVRDSEIKLEDKKSVKSFLSGLNFYDYTLNKTERLNVETLILLIAKDYVTKKELADTMFASRSTVTSDINGLSTFIKQKNISLVTKPGKGLSIDGSHRNKREALIDFVYDNCYLINMFINSVNNLNENIAFKIEENKKTIFNIIGESEYRNSVIFSEKSFEILSNYLLVLSLSTDYDHESIDESDFISDNLDKNIAYSLYKQLIEHFEHHYDIDECIYLSKLISNLQFRLVGANDDDSISINFITRELIDSLSRELSIPLFLDYKLFESLSLHIERMKLYKIEDIVNYPELKLIAKENKDLFKKIKKHSEVLSSYFNREIYDIEISYIVIYVYASLERMIDRACRRLKSIVVCNSGIGTSQLLNHKLEELFKFKIVGSTTSHQLRNMDLGDIDIIITTVDLYNINKEYIKVSPLINAYDYKKISDYIYKKSRSMIKNYDLDFTENKSKKQNNEKKDLFLEKMNSEEGNSLEDFLVEDNIVLDIEVSDWKESIKMASEVLLDKKFISEEYVSEMIENIEEFGPYVVVSENFALPHGKISSKVNKTSMSLTRLRNPVNFGSPVFDPIKFVCILAVDENKDHLKALFELINLLKIDEFKRALELARTSEEVRNQIIKYNRIFN